MPKQEDCIEYQVREVRRWIVTRFEKDGTGASSSVVGTFEVEDNAHAVCVALMVAEHEGKSLSESFEDVTELYEVGEIEYDPVG